MPPQPRQVVCAWEDRLLPSPHTRLWILWDNDVRDSLASLTFETRLNAMKHLSKITDEWKSSGQFVDVTNITVLNTRKEHENWTIDYDPKGFSNGRCFTLT